MLRGVSGSRSYRRSALWSLATATAVIALVRSAGGVAPVRYRFIFAEPEHHWMQVEAAFSDLDQAPLDLRMSRSSPGRYTLHDFAKNVYDVHVFSADGRELPLERPDASAWTVTRHDGAVTVKYKIYGDYLDGTYLAVDVSHAHINMPAAVMWARGLDDRPAVLTFEPPARRRGSDDVAGLPTVTSWRVATQLHAGSTPFEFTAPNLQYLMDSPVEFGPIVVRQFKSGPQTFRLALHHLGTDKEADAFVNDVAKIVAQEGAIYGEFPSYEPECYTFLADYLPYASADGMEHRNSTVMTSSGSIRDRRLELLDIVAHEFFHSWNVERIRPKSLEPFNLDRPNMSGELWLAEGFTQYYGPLAMHRAGLMDVTLTARTLSGLVDTVVHSPGRLVRSAEEMSRMAPFIDNGRPSDRVNWPNTVISYYPFGGAIALALDLTLRDRSGAKITLDDYMRAMWRVHGKPGGNREGYVDRPYTSADAEARLAEVSGDRQFAHQFFVQYIQGHEVADYRRLLALAGFEVRKRNAGLAWWGDLQFETRNGATHIAALVAPTAPAYAAGLDQDDEIRQADGERIASIDALNAIIRRHKPGDRLDVVYADRSAVVRKTSVTLVEDPHQEVVPVETAGGRLTPEQKAFRDGWLGAR